MIDEFISLDRVEAKVVGIKVFVMKSVGGWRRWEEEWEICFIPVVAGRYT